MMKRRLFLGVSSSLFALAACAGDTPLGSNTEPGPVSKKTYVLVHGAWHGGWCWRDVKALLVAQGHDVRTPTLTGLGERSHLLTRDINLTTNVTDIVKMVEFEDLTNIILVGHSYSGYIVSLVADRIKDKIRHIVYLDASLPEVGKSFIPLTAKAGMEAQYATDYAMPIAGLDFLGIPNDHPKADWVTSKLTPHPLGTMFEPVTYQNGGPDGVAKTFIRATGNPRHKSGDPVKAMIEQNATQNNEWRYTLIDTGHDAMVTAPNALADILLAI